MRLVVALLLVGCQQSNPQPSTGSGSSAVTPAAKPAPNPVTKPKSTLDLALPPSSGKPPKKTTAPMSQAIADKLVALRFPDFTIEMTPYPDSIAIRQRANGRPRMSVNIAVGRCGAVNACRPMEVAAWRADKAKLMQTVDPQLRDRPDSVFEIDSASINGAPAISIYQAGQFFGTDEAGNPVGSFSHALTLHYNDGVNFLRVTASFSDNARDSIADMQAALPRPFLARVTTAFLDAYGQAWAE